MPLESWHLSWWICMERDTNLREFWRSHFNVMEWKFLEWRFIVFWNFFRKKGEEAFTSRAHVQKDKACCHTKEVYLFNCIRKQSDLRALTLCGKLKDRFWISVSARTVRRMRKMMGFVRKRTRYCQLISAKNQKVSLTLHLYNKIKNQFDNYKLKRSLYAKFLWTQGIICRI